MIAHTGLGVRDFAAAKRFYQSALAPLVTRKMEHPGYTQEMIVRARHRTDERCPEEKKKEDVEAFYHPALPPAARQQRPPPPSPSYSAFFHDLTPPHAVFYDYNTEPRPRAPPPPPPTSPAPS